MPKYRFWVQFRGTRNGEHIEADSLPAAKQIFAEKHGLSSVSQIEAKKPPGMQGPRLRRRHSL